MSDEDGNRVSGRQPSQDIPTDPKHHPEWSSLDTGMRAQGAPAALARAGWGELLQGIRRQEQMNLDGRRRKDNPHFFAFADLREPYLDVPDANLTLWSGGFAVSDDARLRKQCATLESTALGGVLDRLELHRDWKCIGPLWNTISRRFVKQGHGIACIFLRVHAPDSVLRRQEVPMPGINTRILRLRWHALCGKGDWPTFREIDTDGALVDDHAFPDEYHARMAMKTVLVRLSRHRMGARLAPSTNLAAQERKID